MKQPPSILRYVDVVRKCFIALSCIVLPGIMVCAVFAFAGDLAFRIVTPVLLIAYLVVYGWYALRVSMGTVIGLETTEDVVHVRTKRRTFTYDVRAGCVRVRETKHAYIVSFRTQTAQDSFLFYRRAPFSKPYETAFTAEDIARFYQPADDVSV